MQNHNSEDTQPNPLDNSSSENGQIPEGSTVPINRQDPGETVQIHREDTIEVQISKDEPKLKQHKPKRWVVIVGGILLMLTFGAAGGWFGYNNGLNIRLSQQQGQVAMVTATQFALAEMDFQNGNFETAQKRLEYVIQLDPNFPGASDRLTEVMVQLAIINQPTIKPTPTLSPTPDTRGEEELFNQLQQFMRAGDWNNAITAIEALRKINPEYRVVDVDGMYYIALRNRGLNKIINEGSLELGIYDLTLAGRFGPLDKEAESFRDWARYYLTGSSFWEVDWPKVLEYFGQIYPSLPNLIDSSGWTALERYRVASIRYGDQLAQVHEDYCGAREQYRHALEISPDQVLAPTATQVAYICAPPTSTPEPTQIVPTASSTQEGGGGETPPPGDPDPTLTSE